uniref:Protein SEC13 homolog n=1 Tax=Panagrolaimus sp. JU765 TaxID=591449 RepID=A0AC34QU84_9BILA
MLSLSSSCARVETSHRDVVHDAQLNFYGNRLATCSSDRLVKIFEIKANGQSFPVAELNGHEGPVWQVSWAHPQLGPNTIATCSHDRKAIVWRELNGKWQKSYEYKQHKASVNSISWAPHQYGLVFACCSTDGSISIIECKNDVWIPIKVSDAHANGVNAISWAPAKAINSNNGVIEYGEKRLVSGGNDNLVKVWKSSEDGRTFNVEAELNKHVDWVRDVAWAPCDRFGYSCIASCGVDRRLIVWKCLDLENRMWSSFLLYTFDDIVWHVSWSLCASTLAVAGADNKVSLWQERIQDKWVELSNDDEDQDD